MHSRAPLPVADVYTHFRIAIPRGQSTFSIQVPHRYLEDQRRRFFFSQIHLVPNFYSLDAEKLALDADPAMDALTSRDFSVKIYYRDTKLIYGNEYINSTSLTKTVNLISAINQHFEDQKPAFAYTTPFFIDWVDTALMKSRGADIKQIVTDGSDMYYGGDFDDTQYGNALPASARSIEGVNNFAIPWSATTGPDIFNKRIRLRLWLAPYTKAVFSNIQIFIEDLGFAPEQMGRSTSNQIHLSNSKPNWIVMAVAKEAPKEQFTKREFKMRVWMAGPYLNSKIKRITMTGRDWVDDTKLTQAVSEAVKECSYAFNTIFTFSFNMTEKRYVVTFPDTDLLTIHLVCDPEFSHRIGMGYDGLIVKGLKAEPQKDRMDNAQDAARRAAAVVFDTGPLACVLEDMASNTASQAVDEILTALYPTGWGTLSMSAPVCHCNLATSSSKAIALSANRYTGTAYASIAFRLLRLYDNQILSNFSWNHDGYIYGVLQGTCLLPEYAAL